MRLGWSGGAQGWRKEWEEGGLKVGGGGEGGLKCGGGEGEEGRAEGGRSPCMSLTR